MRVKRTAGLSRGKDDEMFGSWNWTGAILLLCLYPVLLTYLLPWEQELAKVWQARQ